MITGFRKLNKKALLRGYCWYIADSTLDVIHAIQAYIINATDAKYEAALDALLDDHLANRSWERETFAPLDIYSQFDAFKTVLSSSPLSCCDYHPRLLLQAIVITKDDTLTIAEFTKICQFPANTIMDDPGALTNAASMHTSAFFLHFVYGIEILLLMTSRR